MYRSPSSPCCLDPLTIKEQGDDAKLPPIAGDAMWPKTSGLQPWFSKVALRQISEMTNNEFST